MTEAWVNKAMRKANYKTQFFGDDDSPEGVFARRLRALCEEYPHGASFMADLLEAQAEMLRDVKEEQATAKWQAYKYRNAGLLEGSVLEMSDTLIFGTCHIGNQDRLWLVRQWIRTVTHFNPEADILVLNAPGPIPFPSHPRVEVHTFAENIGHLNDKSLQGRDGWGRAFCQGLMRVALRGYRYAAHIETDLLFMQGVGPVCRSLGTAAGAPWGDPHNTINTALMFFRELKLDLVLQFVKDYDWSSMQPSQRIPTPDLPEQRVARLLGDQLTLLPGLLGRRDEGKFTPATVPRLDWLTHSERPTYEAFLRLHGMS